MGRPHTRHRRPVPRRIEDMPDAANNSRFDNRARMSRLRAASGRTGIIAGPWSDQVRDSVASRSGPLLWLAHVDEIRLAWLARESGSAGEDRAKCQGA
jgi:hypothetical protein